MYRFAIQASQRFAVSVTVLVAALALLLAAPFAAHAQTTGIISGTVTDKAGALIPGVAVSARNTATNETRTATTNAAGEYSFPALQPADYIITFTLKGFSTQAEAATLNIAEHIAVNTSLQVGDVSTTVTVTSAEPLLQTDSTTLGDVISGASVDQLPLATNNFTQLLALSPGVVGPVNDATGLGRGTQNYNVNGARTNSNSIYEDGVDAVNIHVSSLSNNTFGSNGAVIPPIDDIQEIKIQLALFDATTGRAGGSNTFVLTKSGTNQLHGSIYDYFRNTIFNANSYFLKQASQPRPELQQNQFGGTLGGALIKDKLFGFFGYQGTRQNNGYNGRTSLNGVFPYVPAVRTAATLGAYYSVAANFKPSTSGAQTCATSFTGPCIAANGSNISPVALAILNLKFPNGQYVIPTVTNGQYSSTGTYAASNVSRFNEDLYVGGMDYQLGTKDRLSFDAIIAEQPQFYATASTRFLPGFGVNQYFKSRLYSVGETHIFTPNLVNTFHFGLNRLLGHTGQQNPIPLSSIGMTRFNSNDFPDIPLIELSGSFEIGYSVNADQSDTDNTFQFFDNASYLKGKHSLTFGGEMRRYQDNYYSNYNARGSLDFISFQNFLLGQSGAPLAAGGNGTNHSDVYEVTEGSGVVQRYDRIRDVSFFFSDNYKVTQRLTLIAGVRYDYIGLPTDIYGRDGAFDLRRYIAPPAGGYTSVGFTQAGNARNPVPGIAKVSNTLTDNVNKLNFAPRVGFALAMNKNMVLRGGYGLFYDRLSNQLGLLESLSTPNYEGATTVNTSAGTPYNLTTSLANPFSTLPQRSQFPILPVIYSATAVNQPALLSINDIDPKLRTPYYQQFGLQLQMELPHGFLAQIGYVGANGMHLPSQTEINQAQIASPTNPVNGVTTNNTGANDTASARAPYQGFSNTGLVYIQTNESSNYNALQTTLIERFKRSTITASYAYSKSMDDGSGTADGSVFTNSSGDQTNPQQAYGPSLFNRTHRATVRLTQPIPLPPFAFARHGVGRRVFSNFELSIIGLLQSGAPVNIVNSGGAAYYGTDTSRGSYAPGFSSSTGITYSGTTEKRLSQYFNTAGYVTAGNFYGNVSRNTLVGPGSRNADVSLTKFIPIHDNLKAEFRAQAFNISNTPNFANPAGDVGTSTTFGVISSTVGNPRILQFALKLTF